ncbi:blr7684 [Bradyrhizobium diazoefficiens USDA 110]|jgi:hypothetical protein|uniref:Blr7684 protein n=1 Tax=Bradyrhizobium diazoefficiens (strain JCM 10833 / BCRC 13528 / IAM 13628 / NBRC 14792 / USDA 110) TaxID=224911 RepID=Q89CW1_BRADU|nr:hypothetical protein BD122_17575 [Bradyrhizobium diazoefficiens]BAC52949.1 blr7684 [Bradyrhizobium diazoefficiens USDA 110]KOY04513.1 hypothetical protein AF336_41725 [Bradyrhizobium diazoefficiens]PDT55730.1 hypothetical protein CO678_42270 [Bradyrhizobium diazoefficiens]QBP26423.1 hypothetical protein Bdiaspc4_40605 [Bradyrhizobium diazoefficiens]
MSSVLRFQRPRKLKSGTSPSDQRLPDVLANVAALLSQVEALKIKTADDARQAIFLLELANTCIRLIVGQTNLDEEVRKALLAHSAMIDMRLGAARRDASILKS